MADNTDNNINFISEKSNTIFITQTIFADVSKNEVFTSQNFQRRQKRMSTLLDMYGVAFALTTCEARIRPKPSHLRFRYAADADMRRVRARRGVECSCMGQIRPSSKTRRRRRGPLLGHTGGTRSTPWTRRSTL